MILIRSPSFVVFLVAAPKRAFRFSRGSQSVEDDKHNSNLDITEDDGMPAAQEQSALCAPCSPLGGRKNLTGQSMHSADWTWMVLKAGICYGIIANCMYISLSLSLYPQMPPKFNQIKNFS